MSEVACLRSERREQRRRRFVEVAERLFLERGFAGTSVNEVVRIAGGSLATLYAEFRNKDDLFEAVFTRRAGSLFEEAEAGFATRGSVRERILELATRMQQRVLSPDSLAIYRLAVTEGPHFESLRHAILKLGLDGFLDRLALTLARIAREGALSIDDPRLAAQRLLTLVQGQLLFAAACGDARRTTRPIRSRELEHAVDAFLAIYRRDGALGQPPLEGTAAPAARGASLTPPSRRTP